MDQVIPALRDVLGYDAESGNFLWKVTRNSRGGGVFPGKVAGTPSGQGYVQIKTGGKLYRAHRLAWAFMTGAFPEKGQEIDQINADRADNRWSNLRLVTKTLNARNQGIKRNNKSGCKGVSFRKDIAKWHARITVDGTILLLGNFSSVEEATRVRRDAEVIYFGDNASIDPTRLAVKRHCAPEEN